jgi:hypothetical protein
MPCASPLVKDARSVVWHAMGESNQGSQPSNAQTSPFIRAEGVVAGTKALHPLCFRPRELGVDDWTRHYGYNSGLAGMPLNKGLALSASGVGHDFDLLGFFEPFIAGRRLGWGCVNCAAA